ncbi:hypothetical protein L596_028814 [Steinernema carpocapsae]|uniref:Uncharacterized protein n=1 Tax=Steinernema carpocapsae TaxID=34508 RepID=A0A4U5LZF5_STECR|nr:hypothetical protein L596_028814 [Steinernema carpocapsae]
MDILQAREEALENQNLTKNRCVGNRRVGFQRQLRFGSFDAIFAPYICLQKYISREPKFAINLSQFDNSNRAILVSISRCLRSHGDRSCCTFHLCPINYVRPLAIDFLRGACHLT